MASTTQGSELAPRFSSPQEEALLTILRSADCLHRAFQQRLKPFGLTATQYNVLRILRGTQSKGLTCSSIGSMMITPEPDITRLLTRMKARKLVSQQRDKNDGRVVRTHLTVQGTELLQKLDGVVEQAPRELLGELTCGEVNELIRLLSKAQSCGGSEILQAEQASPSGKPHSPHLPRLTPLRRHPE